MTGPSEPPCGKSASQKVIGTETCRSAFAAAQSPISDVAALERFPFCACQDYRCQVSPYRLKWYSRTEQANDVQLCFRIDNAGCDARNACCQMISANLGKVEINVDKTCKGAVGQEATINGFKKAIIFDDSQVTGSLKVTPLNFNQVPKCDCISAFAIQTSRWRMAFDNAQVTGEDNVFTFSLYTVPPEECWGITYRPGSCCNQTLENVGLSLRTDVSVKEALLTTHEGLEIPTVLEFNEWGVKIFPTSIGIRSKFWIPEPTLYVTNVTAPWTLTVTLPADSWSNTDKFPCQLSAYTPDEPGNCDYAINGEQTVPGNPEEVLDPFVYDTPGCCPEAIMKYSYPGPCCVETLESNPYRLAYVGEQSVSNGDTILLFTMAFGPISGAPPDTFYADCSATDIDQILIYVDAMAIANVMDVEFDGQPVNFVKDSDETHTWLRIINLHYTASDTARVGINFNGKMTANELCTTKSDLATPMCEYTLLGQYDSQLSEYTCCPHGGAQVKGAVCPPTI
eukprot:gene4426-14558_t